ncbi:MAG: fumarylacetoacetate hydrolase family protein [Wenzhouxiangella sp.]|nr:fumarylacetoacetate hydrolase family protein [Wenzhouxiangella sp.]
MSADEISWQPPHLAVAGGGDFPVRHVWCVGRNYAEHAREMGVDPDKSDPVFFSKPAASAHQQQRVQYPATTEELHHEGELVVCLAEGGRNLGAEQWAGRIFGFAVGVDLTRRDVQARFKKAGQPWELSKGFDQAAPVGVIVRASDWSPDPEAGIELQVNGILRQQATLGEMIWSVPKLLERLSQNLTLHAGDVLMTGTPAGVGPLKVDDRVLARISGLPVLEFSVRGA